MENYNLNEAKQGAFRDELVENNFKPLNFNNLNPVSVVKNIHYQVQQNPLLKLINNLAAVTEDKKLPIHYSGRVNFVNLSEVVCLEAESNYTRLHTNGGKIYNLPRHLKYFDACFPENKFVRVNKSVIINIDYIQGYSKGALCIVWMKNNLEFEVSRRKKNEINSKINKVEGL